MLPQRGVLAWRISCQMIDKSHFAGTSQLRHAINGIFTKFSTTRTKIEPTGAPKYTDSLFGFSHQVQTSTKALGKRGVQKLIITPNI